MKHQRKGIILAGGTGSRLYPLTKVISKQLMPIYNKPMIFYPLTTLMLSNIREVIIITNPNYLDIFKELLEDGSQWGMKIEYKAQSKPEGIAQALIIAEKFINKNPCALILGDNLFYGQNLGSQLRLISENSVGATLFGYRVKDPERYGVIEFDKKNNVKNITEKPNFPKSNYAVTGLYFYDENVSSYAKELKPSSRNELEITDLNRIYLNKELLRVELFNRGVAWLDTGTFDSLHDAGTFIKTIEKRQGLQIASPEEISWRNNWITKEALLALSLKYKGNYGNYLSSLIN